MAAPLNATGSLTQQEKEYFTAISAYMQLKIYEGESEALEDAVDHWRRVTLGSSRKRVYGACLQSLLHLFREGCPPDVMGRAKETLRVLKESTDRIAHGTSFGELLLESIHTYGQEPEKDQFDFLLADGRASASSIKAWGMFHSIAYAICEDGLAGAGEPSQWAMRNALEMTRDYADSAHARAVRLVAAMWIAAWPGYVRGQIFGRRQAGTLAMLFFEMVLFASEAAGEGDYARKEEGLGQQAANAIGRIAGCEGEVVIDAGSGDVLKAAASQGRTLGVQDMWSLLAPGP